MRKYRKGDEVWLVLFVTNQVRLYSGRVVENDDAPYVYDVRYAPGWPRTRPISSISAYHRRICRTRVGAEREARVLRAFIAGSSPLGAWGSPRGDWAWVMRLLTRLSRKQKARRV